MAFGAYMGWNGLQETTRMAHAFGVAHTTWARFTEEIPWHLPTPDNEGNAGVLDTTAWADIVALARANNQRLICIATGVPREVNPNAGSSDAEAAASGGDGQWHWYPNTDAGRLLWAQYCVSIAGELDPEFDVIELGNELNIHQFNHGDQSAAEIAESIGDAAEMIRAFFPDLKIMCGGVANRGDIDNVVPSDVGWTGSQFLRDLVLADPRLATLIDYWSYHPYIYGRGNVDFFENDPMGDQGWGLRQMDQAYEYLQDAGVAQPKLWVTEYGEPSAPSPTYTTDYAILHSARYFQAFDERRNDGRLDPEGAEIRGHMLNGEPGAGPIFENFGVWESDYAATTNATQYIARADRTPTTTAGPISYTFTPPLAEKRIPNQDIDPIRRAKNPLGNRLMRHFLAAHRGTNVFIKADGTATSEEPSGEEYPAMRRVFYGGHGAYPITSAEKVALEAAGFAVDGINVYTNGFDTMPPLTVSTITGLDNNPHTATLVSGRLRVTAGGGNLDENARLAYGFDEVGDRTDAEVRSTIYTTSEDWDDTDRFQVGHAHRIGPNGTAIVVSNNIYFGAHWYMQFTFWINGVFTTESFELADYLHPGGVLAPLPWYLKSRVVGSTAEFAIWKHGDTECAYGTVGQSGSATIPAGHADAGAHGLYFGHLHANDSADVDDITITVI